MLLDWNALGMIISKFLRSPDGANRLDVLALLRLKMVISYLESLAQQLSDGSIAIADFCKLQLKEERFVDLANRYASPQPSIHSGSDSAQSSLPDQRFSQLQRVRDSFSECRARLQRYEEQRERIKFFVEHFRTFVALGIKC